MWRRATRMITMNRRASMKVASTGPLEELVKAAKKAGGGEKEQERHTITTTDSFRKKKQGAGDDAVLDSGSFTPVAEVNVDDSLIAKAEAAATGRCTPTRRRATSTTTAPSAGSPRGTSRPTSARRRSRSTDMVAGQASRRHEFANQNQVLPEPELLGRAEPELLSRWVWRAREGP